MTTQLWIRGRETFVGQLAIDNNLEEGIGCSVLLFLQMRPSAQGNFEEWCCKDTAARGITNTISAHINGLLKSTVAGWIVH